MRASRRWITAAAIVALTAPPVAAQRPPVDRPLFDSLAGEVRQFVRTRPGASSPSTRDENERIVDLLVRLQAIAGDASGAVVSATTLNASSRAWQWIADRQRQSGDHAGLAATIAVARDHETLATSVVQTYIALDSLDVAAEQVRALTGGTRRRLEADVAVARAGHGDWASFRQIDLALLGPLDQVEVLSQLTQLLRQRKAPEADSIARLAIVTAAAVPDSADREVAASLIEMRVRGAQTPPTFMRIETMGYVSIISSAAIDTATSGPARVQALRNRAIIAARGGNLDSALAALSNPLMLADSATLAPAMVDVAVSLPDQPNAARDAARSSLVTRADRIADALDSATADQLRARMVGLLARRDVAAAQRMLNRVRASWAKTQARAALARAELAMDITRGISDAILLRPAPVADSILREAVVLQMAAGATADAAATRLRITSPALRTLASVDMARAFRASGARPNAIRAYTDACDAMDPWSDYVQLTRSVLSPLVELSRSTDLAAWARGKSGVAGAWSRLALMGAMAGY